MKAKNEKALLRNEYRLNRKSAKSDEGDGLIFSLLMNCEAYKNADAVFTYYSVGDEVDTVNIITKALADGKKVALPKCTDKNGMMKFYFIESIEGSLVDGMFSIREPDVSVCNEADYFENSICLVPGIAFDVKGTRLGLGGGYYDRFLSNFKGKKIGLCYEACLCDELPSENHDIKVEMIITDKKVYELQHRRI